MEFRQLNTDGMIGVDNAIDADRFAFAMIAKKTFDFFSSLEEHRKVNRMR